MDSLAHLRERWYRQDEIAGLSLRLNDSVRVLTGEHAGKEAFVISVERLEPEPMYLIELGSGAGDLIISQSDLSHLA